MKEYACHMLQNQLTLFEEQGVDVQQAVLAAGLDPELVKNKHEWIDWEQGVAVMKHIESSRISNS